MYRNLKRFQEDQSQLYETEERDVADIARYLQTHYPQWTRVFEPCVGHGALARALEARGFSVPIQRDKYTLLGESHDFLVDALPDPQEYDITITNTPFARKLEFFQRLQQTNKAWAAIFPLDLVARLRRSRPTTRLKILVPRQNMVFKRGDGERQQIGMQCVWFVSVPGEEGGITVEYLD